MRAAVLSGLLLLVAGAAAQEAARSSDAVRADPRAQYVVVKRTFAALHESGTIPPPARRGERSWPMNDCSSGLDYLGQHAGVAPGEPLAELVRLAYDVVRLRVALTALGYPEGVWRPALVRIEDEQLPLLLREAGRPRDGFAESASERHWSAATAALRNELNRWRQQHAPQLARIEAGGECGAGEVGIQVVTEPRNGRVLFIPVFFHALCQAQRIDPDDPRRCDRWRESVDGMLFDVAGDYLYRAVWPDGQERRGRLSFTNLKDGQRVVFRKP